VVVRLRCGTTPCSLVAQYQRFGGTCCLLIPAAASFQEMATICTAVRTYSSSHAVSGNVNMKLYPLFHLQFSMGVNLGLPAGEKTIA
jgi:hypothetical protein